MGLSEQLTQAAARLLHERGRSQRERCLELARAGAHRAAERIPSIEQRVTTLADASRHFTDISLRCLDQLLQQGLASVHGALEDSTERLRATAQAQSLAELYAAQRASLPASRQRIAQELGSTVRILADTGRALSVLAWRTGNELVRAPERRRAPSRQRPRRAAAGRRRTRARTKPRT